MDSETPPPGSLDKNKDFLTSGFQLTASKSWQGGHVATSAFSHRSASEIWGPHDRLGCPESWGGNVVRGSPRTFKTDLDVCLRKALPLPTTHAPTAQCVGSEHHSAPSALNSGACTSRLSRVDASDQRVTTEEVVAGGGVTRGAQLHMRCHFANMGDRASLVWTVCFSRTNLRRNRWATL